MPSDNQTSVSVTVSPSPSSEERSESATDWSSQEAEKLPEASDALDMRLRTIEEKLDALLEPLFDAPDTQDLQEELTKLDVGLADLAGRADRAEIYAKVRNEQLQRTLVAFGIICQRQDAALSRLDRVLSSLEGLASTTEHLQSPPLGLIQVTQDFERKVAEMLLHLKQAATPQGDEMVSRLENLFERFDAALSASQSPPLGLIQATQDFERKVAEMLLHLKQAATPQGDETVSRLENLFERFDAALSVSQSPPLGLIQATQDFERKVAEMLLHLKQAATPAPIDLEAVEGRFLKAAQSNLDAAVPAAEIRRIQFALAELLAENAMRNASQTAD